MKNDRKQDLKRVFRLAYRVLTERPKVRGYTDWNDNGRFKEQIIRSDAWYEYQMHRLPLSTYHAFSDALRRHNYESLVQRTRRLVAEEPENVSLRKYARCLIRRCRRRLDERRIG